MSDRQEDINKLLLDPTFRNWALKANTKDHQYWTAILTQDKDLLPLAEEARRIILSLELQDNNIDDRETLRALERLQRRLLNTENQEDAFAYSQVENNTQSHFTNVGILVKVAAVLAFFVLVGWMVHQSLQEVGVGVEDKIQYVEKRTTNGQQLSVKLPDGSSIKLNNNSTVKVPEDFINNRRVILDGEAFFDVTRNEYLPFRIHSKNLMIEVLGTSFNVQAMEKDYVVSVVSGKVRVSDTLRVGEEAARILQESQAIAYDLHSGSFQSRDFNSDDLLWKDGILVFKDQNIRQIATKLERWFNVDITLDNEQYIGSHYTAKYPRESLEEILIGMGTVLNFDFKIDNNRVLIKGKPQQL